MNAFRSRTSAEPCQTLQPGYENAAGAERDKTGYDRLGELADAAEALASRISDTQTGMGSEAYQLVLTICRLFDSAAREGIPGADAIHRRLSERFGGQGDFKTGDAAATGKPAREDQRRRPA